MVVVIVYIGVRKKKVSLLGGPGTCLIDNIVIGLALLLA
jgi:hypothetical protein